MKAFTLRSPLALLVFLVLSLAASRPALGQPSQPIHLETPTGTIYGTLELPYTRGPWPAALIISGSGPTDRDGNSSLIPGRCDSLKMLAEGLALHGIASIRYDKRGVGSSAPALGDESRLRFDDFVRDAVAWARQVRADRRFTSLTIVGHSEGSLIGILAAKRLGGLKLVSLEGPGRPAGRLLIEQLRPQLPPATEVELINLVGQLEIGHLVSHVPTAVSSIFRRSEQPYLVSWFRYNPALELRSLAAPVLVVQGTTDVQVSQQDAHLLAGANSRASLLIVPGMNHVLKPSLPDRTNEWAAYENPNLPIDPDLIQSVAHFILHAKP